MTRRSALENRGVALPRYKRRIFHTMVILPDGRIYAGEAESNRANIHRLVPRTTKR